MIARYWQDSHPITQPPSHMHVEDTAAMLTIRWRWLYSVGVGFFTFFCIFWDAWLFVWYKHAFQDRDACMFMFPIIHLMVGIGVTYLLICYYVNTTNIQANSLDLIISHGPLPWPGLRLARTQIKSLFVQYHTPRKHSPYWSVAAVLPDGQKQILITKLPTSSHAEFVRQQLEERCQLPTTPLFATIPRT